MSAHNVLSGASVWKALAQNTNKTRINDNQQVKNNTDYMCDLKRYPCLHSLFVGVRPESWRAAQSEGDPSTRVGGAHPPLMTQKRHLECHRQRRVTTGHRTFGGTYRHTLTQVDTRDTDPTGTESNTVDTEYGSVGIDRHSTKPDQPTCHS